MIYKAGEELCQPPGHPPTQRQQARQGVAPQAAFAHRRKCLPHMLRHLPHMVLPHLSVKEINKVLVKCDGQKFASGRF